MVLRDINQGVPSGWYYTFPETGFTVQASNYNALITKALRHCEANQLPIDDLPVRIQDFLCNVNPPEICRDPSLPDGGYMIYNALEAFARNAGVVLRGEQLSAQDEEAQRRMGICKTCPHFRHEDERCSKCGCWLTHKAALAIEKCPIGKW